MSRETIAAIATPPGRGAVGMVRLSGPEAVSIAAQAFAPDSGEPAAALPAGRLTLGKLTDRTGALLDHAMLCLRRAPASYTGEDMAELHCHGSPALLLLVLEELLALGGRMARPGEFTQRAFLNGKLALAEAEAVGDLIDADSEIAVKNAAAQLSGVLGRRVQEIYDPLLTVAAHFHAVLDYPEEDLESFTTESLLKGIQTALADTAALRRSYDAGRFYRGGVPCAIVGRPNSGKSSLLNALLGYERAIVTETEGTTRDTVEELVTLGGVPLRLIDTAGLRETDDAAERLGVARSHQAIERAGLVLWVVDGSRPLSAEDEAVRGLLPEGASVLWLWNKSDLGIVGLPDGALAVSAKTGEGLDELAQRVAALFPMGEALGSVLTNARQLSAAITAQEHLTRAAESLAAGMTPDAVVADIELALEALGELNGASLREDMTARIFEKFCIGK